MSRPADRLERHRVTVTEHHSLPCKAVHESVGRGTRARSRPTVACTTIWVAPPLIAKSADRVAQAGAADTRALHAQQPCTSRPESQSRAQRCSVWSARDGLARSAGGLLQRRRAQERSHALRAQRKRALLVRPHAPLKLPWLSMLLILDSAAARAAAAVTSQRSPKHWAVALTWCALVLWLHLSRFGTSAPDTVSGRAGSLPGSAGPARGHPRMAAPPRSAGHKHVLCF